MRSEILAAGVLIASAIIGVRIIDRDRAGLDGALTGPAPAVQTLRAADAISGQEGPFADQFAPEVRIAAARDHQFYINADINLHTAHFLIDTGASYVALRDSAARNAGIYTSWTDFKYPVRTANGETKAALVTIDEIEIDDIRVEGVKAFILPDDQLSVNLLGMSFLSRLEGVEARAGEMVLKG